MGVVAFNYAGFIALYPEFANCGEPLLTEYFDMAGLYCRNDTVNPAYRFGILPQLMNMATAHWAWLNAPRDANGNPAASGTPAPNLVGRVSSASEGSVSVQVENDYDPGSDQWWQQTRYGSAWFAATQQFKAARYFANPTIVPGARYPLLPPY